MLLFVIICCYFYLFVLICLSVVKFKAHISFLLFVPLSLSIHDLFIFFRRWKKQINSLFSCLCVSLYRPPEIQIHCVRHFNFLHFPPRRVSSLCVLVVYNRSLSSFLSSPAPPHPTAQSLHSLGFQVTNQREGMKLCLI